MSEMENNQNEVKEVNNSSDFYSRGKVIIEDIEKYSEILAKGNSEERENAKNKVLELNEKKDRLKDEIYKEAMARSGLDYSKKEKNPEMLRKGYEDQLSDLKKRKQELKLEKIRVEKLNEEKKAEIQNQYNIAFEKYKTMLDIGKISQDLFDSRIENMKNAKKKDIDMLDNSIKNIDDESEKLAIEIKNTETKVNELEKQEIIYNEYGDIYYRLFGEILSDRNKLDKVIDKTNDNTSKEETKSETDSLAKENFNHSARNNATSNQGNGVSGVTKPQVEEKKEEVEEPKKIVVTSKTVFDELYKKLSKGTITDEELNALSETLGDIDNYDKYAITTGRVFNKAKKILKYQGTKTAENIEKFLKDANTFSDDIKFDTSIEKDNVLSHDILNSWKNVDDKLTFTDASFSIEKYIEKIEEYKDSGKELTKDQDRIYKDAMNIKERLKNYRKAVDANGEVTMDRDAKTHNSVFYSMFKNRFKDNSRSLPETREDNSNQSPIVSDKVLDLSSMVNTDITSSDLQTSREDNVKVKETDNMQR